MSSAKFKSRNSLLHNRERYAEHGFLHHEIARRMVDYLNEEHQPQRILNDGAFDNYFTELLQQRFPGAEIVENIESVEHDPAARFDLIVSNLLLQDVWEFEERVRDYQIRLNANGRLFFTTIGVESFENMTFEDGIAMNEFPDIEDIGNYMHALGFKDSVLFIEKIDLTYEKLDTLLNDARVVAGRPFEPFKGLRTKAWLDRWKAHAEVLHDGEFYRVPFDVIYAEGSLSDIKNLTGEGNEIFVDITNLGTKKHE